MKVYGVLSRRQRKRFSLVQSTTSQSPLLARFATAQWRLLVAVDEASLGSSLSQPHTESRMNSRYTVALFIAETPSSCVFSIGEIPHDDKSKAAIDVVLTDVLLGRLLEIAHEEFASGTVMLLD